jgi:uncharacterized protein (DUF2062 family)
MSDGIGSPAEREQSLWTRRVVAPIVAQLTQGVTPDKIALTIALGLALGVFPILGATTILCAVAAVWLKLNQPIIQLVNYAVYPIQVVAIIPLYRAGEALFRQPHTPLSISMLVERFRADPAKFLVDFGMIAVEGIVVWCLLAPIVVSAVYFLMRLSLRALAGRARVVSATAR